MIARVRRSLASESRGFTLVELLVVVVIIGILAAIAIPAFLRQRESAWRAAVESDVKNVSLAVENASIANGGLYTVANGWAAIGPTGAVTPELTANGYNQSNGVSVGVSATATEYKITGSHVRLTAAPTMLVFDSTTGSLTWS